MKITTLRSDKLLRGGVLADFQLTSCKIAVVY